MSNKLKRDAFESMVCERLEAYEPQPPMHVWTKLEANLDGKEIEDKKNRIWLPWASAAAVVLMSVGLTLQTTHPGFLKLQCSEDNLAEKSELKNNRFQPVSTQDLETQSVVSEKMVAVASAATNPIKSVEKIAQNHVLTQLPVEGSSINVASVAHQITPSVLEKIQVPNELISQMNLKEKNLVGAKDESSVVEMTQQEFLDLLRKNGYLNQEIPINQVVAQNPAAKSDKKGNRDFKKFVLKQLGNAQLIQLNDQDPNRMQYQLSTPVIQVSGNVH
jgi:hypothetical protein